MDYFKVMRFMNDPKKYVYAGLAVIIVLFLLGILAGYYIGESNAQAYYIEKLAEATKGCICGLG